MYFLQTIKEIAAPSATAATVFFRVLTASTSYLTPPPPPLAVQCSVFQNTIPDNNDEHLHCIFIQQIFYSCLDFNMKKKFFCLFRSVLTVWAVTTHTSVQHRLASPFVLCEQRHECRPYRLTFILFVLDIFYAGRLFWMPAHHINHFWSSITYTL